MFGYRLVGLFGCCRRWGTGFRMLDVHVGFRFPSYSFVGYASFVRRCLEFLEARFIVQDEGLDVLIEILVPRLEVLRGQRASSVDTASEGLGYDGASCGVSVFEAFGKPCQ
jgi:hypothetical protein